MAAIGTQYHDSPEARAKGSELNEACRKGIDLCLNWSIQTMQAILLTEIFTRFRARKTTVRLSRHFEELYSRLLSDSDRIRNNATLSAQSPIDLPSADALLDRFGALGNLRMPPVPDAQSEWCQWLEVEGRQRLLNACFIFDVHQSLYHQKPRFKPPQDDSRFLVCLPSPEALWNSGDVGEWEARRRGYTPQPVHLIEHELSPEYISGTSSFTQSLLICWFASRLSTKEEPTYPNDFFLRSMDPNVANLMSLFPTSPLAHAYLALYYTPLHDLLAIAGDTWVFGQKITPPSAFHSAQTRLKTWSTSLYAAKAAHHSCKYLSESLSQRWTPTSDDQTNSMLCISDYWSLYVSALICWAFGHRYQTSAMGSSGGLSRRNSSTAIGAMELDDSPISDDARLKALSYVNDMLEVTAEELLTSKASVKGDTLGVIDAVRRRLEIESIGNKCGLLVDAVTVLNKIKEGGRGKWF